MLPALITVLCFAVSGICGSRAALAYGSLRGNALRLLIAAAALGLASAWTGLPDFQSRAARRLLISGVVGFGLGDVSLFLAYPRLGSRLTLLLNLCSAPLFGAAAEAWLTDARLSAAQIVAGAVILAGVGLALGSGVKTPRHAGKSFLPGISAALIAGLGQGCGASLTRWAKVAEHEDGVRLMSHQEAFIRVVPGLFFGALLWQIIGRIGRRQTAAKVAPDAFPADASRWPWLVSAALFGPVLGVSAFQWALGMAPSAVVLSITATTPIVVMPLAMWLENDRPTQAAVAGSLVAVAGVIGMSLAPA